ncbi:MAG TPA: S8 family serine peptidase [Allosphingosinicella sp.]
MRPGRRIRAAIFGLFAMLGAGAGGAQLLPRTPVGDVLGSVGRVGVDALDSASRAIDTLGAHVRTLADARIGRLRDLVRAHPGALEMTDLGPAVGGEIIALDPDPASLAAARAAGFVIVREEDIEGLGLRSVTLAPPGGLSLEKALARLRKLAPEGEFTANHLYLQSGAASRAALANVSLAGGGAGQPAIGIIDGGVAAHPSIGRVEQHGFAAGAPAPSAHATAIASLAAGEGAVRGAAPGAPLLVADVYGRDPTGGNAMAIARALGMMVERRVPVVVVSLVGPANPLLGKAVARAQARGARIVAAVGNDGPAAPPAFPASYEGVIAVTGVDRRDRALIEAGRSLHLDFAAPGADMAAAALGGGLRAVRGTSYAVPFVAGRLARTSLAALGREAKDLGAKGPDPVYGRGLVCGACRTLLPKK